MPFPSSSSFVSSTSFVASPPLAGRPAAGWTANPSSESPSSPLASPSFLGGFSSSVSPTPAAAATALSAAAAIGCLLRHCGAMDAMSLSLISTAACSAAPAASRHLFAEHATMRDTSPVDAAPSRRTSAILRQFHRLRIACEMRSRAPSTRAPCCARDSPSGCLSPCLESTVLISVASSGPESSPSSPPRTASRYRTRSSGSVVASMMSPLAFSAGGGARGAALFAAYRAVTARSEAAAAALTALAACCCCACCCACMVFTAAACIAAAAACAGVSALPVPMPLRAMFRIAS
mmetsp:Transcript_10056/g.41498  ORF Transcript_10056/g.41498 Transcript_10056/m.41498 type:complete len:292 (-) Transcript_10056:411-1286(-)